MINLTKNITEATLITHGGTFHPDDVFSSVFLNKIFPNSIVYRANSLPTKLRGDQIVYDIGYGRFDHHGPNAQMRNDKIKYSSFGLLWKEYGLSYLAKITTEPAKLWQVIDEKLVMQIDGIDNGNFPKIEADYKLMDLDNVIDLFNKAWNEDVDNDEGFKQACQVAEIIFDRLILKEKAKLTAQKQIEKLIAQNNHQPILILDEYMPYNDALFDSEDPSAQEIKIIIFPSNRGGYNIKPRTISKDSKELVVNFPSTYLGLSNDELAQVSNIKDARFVHINGFLACANTLDAAIDLANQALHNKEN